MSNEIAEALAHSKYSDLVHVTLSSPEDSIPAAAASEQTPSTTKHSTGKKKPAAAVDHPPQEQDATNGNSNGTREILLTAKLDHENGGFRWVDVSATEDPIAKHLRTKFWIFPMLNDDRRTALYDQGIQLAAREVVVRCRCSSQTGLPAATTSTTKIHSLDIGSGTGLLAMMSAKYLKQAITDETGCGKHRIDHIQITSLEMSRPMAILARHIVHENGFSTDEASASATQSSNERTKASCETTIDVIEAHSCEHPPLAEPKAMFCTSELLDSGLLGEGWLPAMRDAWERHLDPRAIVVPQRAQVFAQVVEGISGYWGPHKVLTGSQLVRKISLFVNDDGSETLSDGSYDEHGNKHGIQVPIHLAQFLKDDRVKFLSVPLSIFDFDVSRKDSIPGPEGRARPIEFIPIAPGTAEGVIFWWELDIYAGHTYNTNPGSSPWQDHWQACLYVFPQESKDCLSLIPNKFAQLIASHTDSSLHFTMQAYNKIQMNWWRDTKRQKMEMEQREPIVSPRRCWILNDLERSKNLLECVTIARNRIGHVKASVLDISDFPLCAMMAAMSGAAHVTSLESSTTDLPYVSAKMAQIANGLSPQNFHPDNFLIARCHPEHLTTSILAANTRANLIVGEPYYEFLEGHPVQQAFNFYNILYQLKEKMVVCRDIVVMPSRAVICAQGIACPDLSKFYYGQTTNYGGFDHQTLAKYWTFDQHPISLPLHEYDFQPCTKVTEVVTLHNETDEIEIYNKGGANIYCRKWPSVYTEEKYRKMHRNANVSTELLEGFTACHAITFWVDYRLHTGTPLDTSTATRSVDGNLRPDERKYRLNEQVLILRTPHTPDDGPLKIPMQWMDNM